MTAGGLKNEYIKTLKKLKLITTGYNFSNKVEFANTLKLRSKIALMPTILINGIAVFFLEKNTLIKVKDTKNNASIDGSNQFSPT
jgi:hypothetical protein